MGWTFLKRLALLVLLAMGIIPAAFAEIPDRILEELDVSTRDELRGGMARTQLDLAWIGLYHERITGRNDSATADGIRKFQRAIGAGESGTLSDSQRRLLQQRARATSEGYDFQREDVEWLGMTMSMPTGILGAPSLGGKNYQFVNYHTTHTSRLFIELFGSQIGASPRAFLDAKIKSLKEDFPEVKTLESGTTTDGFYASFSLIGFRLLVYAERRGDNWRKIELRYDESEHGALRPVLARIMHSVELFAGRGVARSEQNARFREGRYPGSATTPDWYLTMMGNGSGSLVSRNGHILTNHHVVSPCARLTVNGNPAVLVGTDSRLDLALVRSLDFVGRSPVRFREDNPKLAEPVAVMGYPVFDVSRSLNFTSGLVSSAVGYLGDRTRVQITAPIQPGNSGGPVLDTNGTQIAVVASKASVALQEDSNIENIGWVIRGRQATEFLRRYDVRPILETREPPAAFPKPSEVSGWRQFTVRVECHFR